MTRISRRTVLTSAMATLALPWLSSLEAEERLPGDDRPPRRFVCVTFGNGTHPDHWWVRPGADGTGLTFGDALAPLAVHARHITALPGLRLFDDTRDEGVSGHMYYFANLLSGAVVSQGVVGAGVSVDQVMAKRVGQRTALPSLHLATEPTPTGLIFGAPGICSSTISWRSPTAPIPTEIYPQQVFDRLFDHSHREADRSVLDYLLKETAALRGKLAQRDQRKLDEYTESVRELERRIERTEALPTDPAAWHSAFQEPDLPRPRSGLPASVPEHIALMNDLLVLALRMDKTRIATFIMARDTSDRDYGFVDGVSNAGLHALSHHGTNQKSIEQFILTNRWHSQQVADLVAKLASVDEGGTSLLDSTMLLFTSTMFGAAHDPTNLTPLLIGGRACDISPGRVVASTTFEDRRLCNLHLSLLQRMGVEATAFGNSFHPLSGLAG